MLKPFDEMVKIDVSKHTEMRDGFEYLNWAKCISLLRENGAKKVYFTPIVNAHGSSLFMSEAVFKDKKGVENRCYEVRIHVVIDELEFDFQAPVTNGPNPVKDNSMSQSRVWAAQTRAFVKGVAIHTGLGFSLWLKEEGAIEEQAKKADYSDQAPWKCKKHVEEMLTALQKGNSGGEGMDIKDICAELDINSTQLTKLMERFDSLDNFVKAVKAIYDKQQG